MDTKASDDSVDLTVKLVLIGDTDVGKTNLLSRFESELTGTDFNPHTIPTIGVDFVSLIVYYPGGIKIKAQLWDTAGQERYRAITRSHYRRADGALLVFDVNDRKTLENAKGYWREEIFRTAGPQHKINNCIVLAGNKTDLVSGGQKAQVGEEEQQQVAKDLGFLSTFRTSAHDGSGVVDAFRELIFRAYEMEKKVSPLESTTGFNLKAPTGDKEEFGGCC
eukprot:CAMPEP_0113943712 /NCGR_PEP_ID=MMETSP1339-20121228/26985_1 /TAXON_ID=94617 /ORGANISM="Fibrocapsa japonica" /LENGTH=220 /DNA_ID=CAMNT_0000948655 /DNA_START=30 /DNA_END=695 /DNA_ORIENTATION=- /assembly_acc=CAM_ASM_000762